MTVPEGSTAPEKPVEPMPLDMWGEYPGLMDGLSDDDRAWLRHKVLRRIRRFT